MKINLLGTAIMATLLLATCKQAREAAEETAKPLPGIRLIFDTDANNELDDQHAMAYLFFNGPLFQVEAVTVNATSSGGNIEEHYREAARIMELCLVDGQIPLLKGADKSFEEIRGQLGTPGYDGEEAIEAIIAAARKPGEEPLIVLAVGKLTNVALALEKAPDIANKMRVVWLGSNYPAPGEYNQDNDIPSMNYVLGTEVPFEMVTVRYGDPSGSSAVAVSKATIMEKMPGLGPTIARPITGRHGGYFNTFGDYSVDLFQHIDYYDDPPTRALFDMVAVAILKHPEWGSTQEVPAPVYQDGQWVAQPDNPRKIIVWEHFNKEAMLEDFFDLMARPVL
jgi:inosine-uridine nucleoside N-ribohydrolase